MIITIVLYVLYKYTRVLVTVSPSGSTAGQLLGDYIHSVTVHLTPHHHPTTPPFIDNGAAFFSNAAVIDRMTSLQQHCLFYQKRKGSGLRVKGWLVGCR
jgi:hypothetical protein